MTAAGAGQLQAVTVLATLPHDTDDAAITHQWALGGAGVLYKAELDLVQMARARAMLAGRDYVIPEDVKALAVPAIAHRISLRPEMWVRSVHGSDVVGQLLKRLPVPRARGQGQ